jgi:5-methyltetrahydrofolate--homocysteine methyltransferase
VKSTVVMRENLEEMERRKLNVPVILGGAALNRGYVESDCRKAYAGRVEYAKDAFDGLKLMADIRARPAPAAGEAPAPKERRSPRREAPVESGAAACVRETAPAPAGPIRRDVPVPAAPFFGVRVFDAIPLKTVAPYLNEIALFRVQWQIRQKKMTPGEYEAFLDEEIRPKYFEVLADLGRRKVLQPKAVVGYFRCASEGDTLHVFDDGASTPRESFHFPRQVGRDRLCLADFFRPLSDGVRDVVAFIAVTVGEQASLETARLFREDRYQEYLYVHGVSVEMAEALAEYVHLRIRADLGIGDDDAVSTAELIKQRYRGRRFSPGYPACPELSDQEKIFRLLEPERIGLRLNEEHQLEPEQSTTALVVHHPQAAYFTI